MTGTEFISKHLCEISGTKIHNINSICAFTGKSITRGILLKDALSSNFTDNSFVRYKSEYCSTDVFKCLQPVNNQSKASLRNYSFIVTENDLTILNREKLYDTIVGQKPVPFILAVTYNGKKHITYKTRVQYDNNEFTVFTDIGEVLVRKIDLDVILPIISNWYSVVKGKEHTSTQPTYFSKEEILTGIASNAHINNYGINKFFEENTILEQYRNTPILKLMVFVLKKTLI
jgi:hypothetical protein